MTRRSGPMLAAVLGALLAACSGGTEGSSNRLAPVTMVLRGAVGPAEAPEPFTATRESLSAAGFRGPLLIVANQERGTRAGFVPEATNRGAITWRSGDDVTVRTRGGVLVATRGMLFDLMAADDALFRRTLAAGGGRYVRATRDLDAEGVLRRIDLACTLTRGAPGQVSVLGRAYAVTRWTESCTGPDGPPYPNAPGGRIENAYDVDSGGAIRRSRQWAAPHLGYLVLELADI